MIVAVLSDAHDNIWNLEKALPHLQKAETVIFCGDFCAPFTLEMLAKGFQGHVHAVFGNNDGDAFLLSFIAAQVGNVTLHQGMAQLELGGKRIAFAHYPQIGRALAESGQYHAVFSGHTHRRHIERIKDSLWVNPGEVMGRFGEPTFGFYDTDSGSFNFQAI